MRRAAVLIAIVIMSTACATGGAGTQRPVIVATTTMLGDVVSNIAGDAARVEVLMPVASDPHSYQPSAKDTAALVKADLVVANGLGLEAAFADVLDSSATSGTPVLTLGPLLDPSHLTRGSNTASPSPVLDPHVWMDPVRMIHACELIASQLEQLLPGMGWTERADAYAASLRTADDEIRSILATIPAGSRQIVTNHDSLEYFAVRYDLEIIGVVIPGGSTLADPSSAALAQLVSVMRAHNVKTIFAETTEPTTLADSLAGELGPGVQVVELYTGSLGEPGSGADTLVGMWLTDATRIAQELGP